MVVRTTAGGDYHQYSYLLARFMPKHIPGNPAIILAHMPGGGGIIAANYMANVAPRDGTVMGIVSQGMILDQALGVSPQLKADLRQFHWIANVINSNQLLVVWHTSQTRSIEDAKKRDTLIGTTGAGSASVQYPSFMNNVLGTRFKLVTGYISGTEIDLAMERGEVEGRGTNPYSGYMASRPTWIPQGKLIPLMQSGVAKEPALPNVPLIVEQKVKPRRRAVAAHAGPRLELRPALGDDAGRTGRARGRVAQGVPGHHRRSRVQGHRGQGGHGDQTHDRR